MMVPPAGSSDPHGAGRPPRLANRRSMARLGAVQALYQMEVAGAGLSEVLAEFRDFRLGREVEGEVYRPADAVFFADLVTGVVENQRRIDPLIHRTLTPDWPLKRIDATLRAILRAGCYELDARKDVPARVVISEYLDVSRAFFEDEERRLVNAVLDRLAHRLRPAEFGLAPAAERPPRGEGPAK